MSNESGHESIVFIFQVVLMIALLHLSSIPAVSGDLWSIDRVSQSFEMYRYATLVQEATYREYVQLNGSDGISEDFLESIANERKDKKKISRFPKIGLNFPGTD